MPFDPVSRVNRLQRGNRARTMTNMDEASKNVASKIMENKNMAINSMTNSDTKSVGDR